MNPESLDSSIQSALSALFPPFEVTAPTVLSQLFRLIEERYSSDALQCLLDFLIPSKHLLESIQQAACAGYSDVVFRCEGWPLCLHDKTVIQLAPVNPLLLRPGDFYLQVEPFADQSVRIVLKSLLEEGCREVEETPILETSYPCMFTEEWLQELNEGRHGTPLSCCLLCTDQGVVKLPWAKVAIPEFIDKPKIMPMYQEITPHRKQRSAPSHFSSSTLPVEAIFHPSKDRMSASLRPVECGFKRIPKSRSKPLIKPVGWVSPNNWDSSETCQELEGDYVDLVDITKEQEKGMDKQNDECLQTSVLKPVRPPLVVPCGNSASCACTLQYAEEAGHEPSDHYLKCSYRDSYVAALRNPVALKKGSVDPLPAFGELNLPDGALPSKCMPKAKNDQLENVCNHFNQPSNTELQQYRQSAQTNWEIIEKHVESESLMEDPPAILNSSPGLRHSEKVTMKLISKQPDPNASVTSDVFLENNKPHRTAEAKKPHGKHHAKVRSLSTVSETSKGSPVLYKLSTRSYSDVCPDTINNVMQLKKGELLDQMSRKRERRNSPQRDILSSGSESSSVVDGPVSNLHNSKTERLSSPQSFENQNSSQCGQSNFRSISGLLELGIICLPGSRDRTGRSVVEVHGDRKEWMSPLMSAQNVCELLLYLHSIPRKEIQELGMTLVINARKKAPPPNLYKALLMAQEQALHAVHSVVMLVNKDTCPRPEKYPGLQMDLVTSLKALNKTVDTSQLTSDLGGRFTYSHSDWLQFHQRLVSFTTDLREADSLLQKAIKKVDERSKLDTSQQVEQCVEEQKCSMKEVLEDTRLVMLQREGGAVLARMRREDFRFPQSEDYRDALESATVMYNQVEEKLHTLVMRSNESLQHLDFLFRLRKMESEISMVGKWLNLEGEQMLKDSHTADSLLCAEKALHHYNLFLIQAKEKQGYALSLVTEAKEIVGLGFSGPATDIFETLVRTFKSDIDDFMLRAQERRKELETLLYVHSFCEQAAALAKECSHFLENVEQRCYSASTQSTLQMYEERLDGEFSTLNFQAVKAKACAVGSGAAGAMKVWNAAWVQCQQLRQDLHKMPKNKTLSNKELIQQTTAAHPQPEDGRVEKEEKGSEAHQQNWHREDGKICEREGGASTTGTSLHQYLQPHLTGIAPHATIQYTVFPQTNGSPRGHHSEADLRTVDPVGEDGGFSARQHLGRSLSEGSHTGFQLPSSFLPLNVRNKHCQSKTQPLQLNLHLDHKQIGCLDDSYGPPHLKSKSDRKDEDCEDCADSSKIPQHLTPETVRNIGNSSNNVKLQKIMEELLTTEREYVSALGYVREHYFPELERADVPQDLRGQRGIIFGNIEKLHDFHQHHFLSELDSCVNEPFRVGRCFLRHKGSFALYALYSKNKPQSDALFISHGKAFFKQKQMKLGDKMDLWSYLLKPVQRISKYSLLLKDILAECGPRQTKEIAEVKAALEVINFQLRHGNNLLAMDAIRHCDVNLKEQGQLVRQDEFLVTFRKKKCFRHIFLFQELILFSKTRRTEVGNDTYLYKQSFKTTDIGLTQNSGDTGLCFEIWFRKRKTQDTYTLQAVSPDVKEAWTGDLERILWEQAVHNREIRMQERVFMGIGNKPFMDIKPSEAAISNRAVNCVLIGRDIKLLCSAGSSRVLEDGLPGGRPKSLGSGSSSSSSSSGIGSLSPVRYLCGPKNRVDSEGSGGYVLSHEGLEDDLDQGGVVHNLLDSSESSGESVSGFSSSSHSFHSAVRGEVEDTGSVCSSTATVKEALVVCGSEGSAGHLKTSKQPPLSVPSEPKPQDLPRDKAQGTSVGKSTVV